MRLLGSAATTVLGLAKLGMNAYDNFKGAGSSSASMVSEIKTRLKKKYPFLDESSLNIISKRILENTFSTQDQQSAPIKVGGETNAMTGQVGSGDIGRISKDLSGRFNGQYSPDMVQRALSNPAENPALAGLAQNSLANLYTQKNSNGNNTNIR